MTRNNLAGWRSWLAKESHNLQVVGSSPTPATIGCLFSFGLFLCLVLPISSIDRMAVITARCGFESRIGSKYCQVAELVNAHRQMILIEGTAAVEATVKKNTGSNPVLTTKSLV